MINTPPKWLIPALVVGGALLVVVGIVLLLIPKSAQTPVTNAVQSMATNTEPMSDVSTSEATVSISSGSELSADATTGEENKDTVTGDTSKVPAPQKSLNIAPLKQETDATTSVTQVVKVILSVEDILKSQEKMADALMVNLQGKDKEWRFFDLMAPLGVLDPYANENSSQKDGAVISNQMFGYYGAKHRISQSRIMELAELPLSFATQNFNVDDYFLQNKQKLNDINGLVNSRPDLKILAYWTSGIGRVNETFNAEIGFWKQDQTSGHFVDLSNVSVATSKEESQKIYDSSSVARLNPEDIGDIVAIMASINVTIVYKCAGKTIYIMGSTADNASGFIRNGTAASEVNCGLLANRFEIVKEKQLDSDWIFWVGR